MKKVSELTLLIVKQKIYSNLLTLASVTTDHTRLNEAVTIKHLSIFDNWAWSLWLTKTNRKTQISTYLPNNVGMASVVLGDESEECNRETDITHTHNILSEEVMRSVILVIYMIQYLVCMTCNSNLLFPHFKCEQNHGHKNSSGWTADSFIFQSMLMDIITSPYSALLQVIHTYIHILQLQA